MPPRCRNIWRRDTERSLSMYLQFTTTPLLGDPRLPPRFWRKIRVLSNGCWEWTASKRSRGYGQFAIRHGFPVSSHRLVYETLIGPIAEGLESDHLCRNPACCNPVHLEMVTHQVNVSRGIAGAVNRARQLAKTHCLRGHPLDKANVYHHKDGKRHCHTCQLLRQRIRRAKIRSIALLLT